MNKYLLTLSSFVFSLGVTHAADPAFPGSDDETAAEPRFCGGQSVVNDPSDLFSPRGPRGVSTVAVSGANNPEGSGLRVEVGSSLTVEEGSVAGILDMECDDTEVAGVTGQASGARSKRVKDFDDGEREESSGSNTRAPSASESATDLVNV